jgi:hypothetical protein
MKKAFILLAAMVLLVPMAFAMTPSNQQNSTAQNQPLYVGILIQDNVLHVGNDLAAYRSFIKELPAGSHVEVAYARTGTNLIVQPFTADLAKAAESVRPPAGFITMGPGSPYVSIKDFLKTYPSNDTGARKVLVFVSNGLDPDYGSFFHTLPSADPYVRQAISAARKDDVVIYSIYAPVGGPFHTSQRLAFSGQGALNYLSNRTNGEAFFSGSTYVTAEPFLKDIAAKIG